MIRILVIGCLITLIGCGAKTPIPSNIVNIVNIENTFLYYNGKVALRLVDGRKVQLAGIEVTSYDPKAPTEQRATAIERRGIARHELQILLTDHLRLEYTTGTEENSLPQARVYADDILINAELIRRGYAYAVSTPSNSKYNAMFESLEEEAMKTRSGLWAYEPADSIPSSTGTIPALVVKDRH